MFTRTERLFLRPIWAEDWKDLSAMLADPGATGRLAAGLWGAEPEAASVFAWQEARAPQLLITRPHGGGVETVGAIGLFRRPGERAGARRGEAEFQIFVAPAWRGQGLGAEAAGALLPLARLLGYRRLQAGHAVEDVASGGLLRKLGFRPTGEMALVAAGHPAEMGPGLRSTLVRCALDLPALTGLAGDEDREGDDWGGDDWGGDDDLGGAPTRRAA